MKAVTLNKLVRKALIDCDSTAAELAQSIGVSCSFVSMVLRGEKKMSDSMLEKISAFFDSRGVKVEGLRVAADVSNGKIPLDGLSKAHQYLVASLATMKLNQRDIDNLAARLKQCTTHIKR